MHGELDLFGKCEDNVMSAAVASEMTSEDGDSQGERTNIKVKEEVAGTPSVKQVTAQAITFARTVTCYSTKGNSTPLARTLAFGY